MRPPCDRFVPGYGDANADFHLIGDRPAVHGGLDTDVPFTNATGRRLLAVFADMGLLNDPDTDAPTLDDLFLSYLHLCAGEPTPESYADCERFFDAELRAIGAHVLLPVGERATEHVLLTYTARTPPYPLDMDALHASELRGNDWLVVPIADLRGWDDDHAERLRESLETLLATDYRREADLGQFMPDDRPYLVR
jgi:uracil-DNA glycosylase